MDKSRSVALFISVARARSFSQAAVELGLSPQAVSKSVRQLEAWLGVRLFHRTTRSLSLTNDGQRLFETADPGLRLLDEALEQVKSSRQGSEGLIRIAAPTSVGSHVLVPLIRQFQRSYPDIHFDLLLDDHFTDLVEAKIDVAFRAGNPPARNMVSRRLADLALVICASPEYIAEHGAPKNAAQLQAHRCTGFRQPNTGRMLPWELRIDGGTVYKDVPAVLSFNTVEAEVEAVLAGIGVGQLLLYLIREHLAQGRLVELLPQLATANAGLYMVYQQRTQMPLRVRTFIDFVAEHGKPLFARFKEK